MSGNGEGGERRPGRPRAVVGVDLAGSQRRLTGVCLLRGMTAVARAMAALGVDVLNGMSTAPNGGPREKRSAKSRCAPCLPRLVVSGAGGPRPECSGTAGPCW